MTEGGSAADLANFLRLSPLFPFQPLPLWPVSILLHWDWDRPEPDRGLSLVVTQIFASLLCSNVGLGSQHWQYQSPLFISQALTCCFSHLSKAHKALKMKNPSILNPSKVYMFQYMICIFRYFTHSICVSLEEVIEKESRMLTELVVVSIFYRVIFADSAQTEYCTTFHCPCVRVSVTGVTSHISHIYKGINAMLIIRGPIKPYIF